MKKEDLMIGDWVVLVDPDTKERKITQVTTSDIGEDYILSLFEPLEITPEILEKNGFQNHIMKEMEYQYEAYTEGFFVCIAKREGYDWNFYFDQGLTNIGGFDGVCLWHNKFVHELQHFFKLCKLEKNIII